MKYSSQDIEVFSKEKPEKNWMLSKKDVYLQR